MSSFTNPRTIIGNTRLMMMLRPSIGTYFQNTDDNDKYQWDGVKWQGLGESGVPKNKLLKRRLQAYYQMAMGGSSSPGPRGPGDPSIDDPVIFVPPAVVCNVGSMGSGAGDPMGDPMGQGNPSCVSIAGSMLLPPGFLLEDDDDPDDDDQIKLKTIALACSTAAAVSLFTDALGCSASPQTFSFPEPLVSPSVLIAGWYVSNSDGACGGIDYLANLLGIAGPWALAVRDDVSDGTNIQYITKVSGVWYLPWTSGTPADAIVSWSGVFVRSGGMDMDSIELHTSATAPVQSGWGPSQVANAHVALAAPPTPGNVLVLVRVGEQVVVPAGFTLVHSNGTNLYIATHCVGVGESADVGVTASAFYGVWYLSEWALTGVQWGPE